jgi:hypothetical protein
VFNVFAFGIYKIDMSQVFKSWVGSFAKPALFSKAHAFKALHALSALHFSFSGFFWSYSFCIPFFLVSLVIPFSVMLLSKPASSMSLPITYQSCDRISAHWLMYNMELDTLSGADEVS